MFHSQATGGKSRNLDLFFTGEETVKALLGKHARGADIVLMEGVMGYYDGLGGKTEGAGSYHLARATGTPALLVINPRGMSLSLGALVKGFAGFRGGQRHPKG